MNNSTFLKIAFAILCTVCDYCLQAQTQIDSLRLTHPDSTTLAGVLEIPAVPVVVFIAGSGATDRDGNSLPMMRSDTYKKLGVALQQAGYATLRYDKRTAGASKMPASLDFSKKSFGVFVEDLNLFLEALEQDERISDIVLLGHSQGSLIALMAAQKSEKVKAVISVAGAGRPIGKVLRDQLAAQGLNETGLSEYDAAYASALKGEQPVLENPLWNQFFGEKVFNFMSTWMQINPQEEIKKLDVPVLVINGTNDIQVPIREAELLLAAQPNAQKLFIEGMSHLLKPAPADRMGNMQTYNQPDLALSEGLVAGIVAFLEASL
ncbi:MAG: alpha/beta fold hydrolase [Bacteroidota bacterium]